jgi:hypothetical protein
VNFRRGCRIQPIFYPVKSAEYARRSWNYRPMAFSLEMSVKRKAVDRTA